MRQESLSQPILKHDFAAGRLLRSLARLDNMLGDRVAKVRLIERLAHRLEHGPADVEIERLRTSQRQQDARDQSDENLRTTRQAIIAGAAAATICRFKNHRFDFL